ncbi:MAG: DUF3868 domain-containing protein [Muribaculum sp.]|nr:DUF3868 domain-containing protein [Muribaculum sp.]
MKQIFRYTAALLTMASALAASAGVIGTSRPVIQKADDKLHVSIEFKLDSIEVESNHQLFVTPVIDGPQGQRVTLPALLVNGRNMHYVYERGTLNDVIMGQYVIAQEVRRINGQPQSVEYAANAPYNKWMMRPGTSLQIVVDTCGCGDPLGKGILTIPLNLTPKMRTAYITPEVTELPISVHEGRARVQFEVDKTVLHDEPYTCRNGQRIDNREQLKIIDDSVAYALSNPNVEIASINICGYASPESPYLHNEELSMGRSRALAVYLAGKYQLPREKCTYNSVPENWREFREIVVDAPELTERQRANLLELIDRPTYGPRDFDDKERELKTDKRFASLYKNTILPKWFPRLRATEFTINTRLKPLSDEELAKVIYQTPELMSLNQMMRVARLYPEGGEKFNEIIEIARQHYPDDVTANLNAAIAALQREDYTVAEELLQKAGNSPEAENARGVVEVHRGDFDKAAEYFRAAGDLPEAIKNLNMLE